MRTLYQSALLRVAIVVVVLLLLPGLAHAAGGGDSHDNKGNFIDIHRYDLGIYTLIVFGILFYILSRYAWGPFTEGLRKREEGLLAIRNEAQQVKREAEEVRRKLQAEFASANDKIRALLEEARRDADELRVREREAGQKDAASERERAKREIGAAKDAALQEIYQQSVQLASLMSSKAIRRGMTLDDHSRLVEESLAELKTAPSRN